MIYTKDTRKAMTLAYAVHNGQLDKSGVPYIFHPITVAESMETEDEIIVALLHDTIEDCGVTKEYLAAAGFSRDVVEAVEAMSKRKGETYDEYIARVKTNRIARKVKIADLKHNMDLTRLIEVTEQAEKRVNKYKKALEVLNE